MSSRPILLFGAALALLIGGCSGGSRALEHAQSSPQPRPAEPATAAVPIVPPAGRVVQVGNAPEGIVVGTSGIAAVAVRHPDGIALIDAATGALRQTIAVAGAARHLSLAGPDGPVLVPLESSNQLATLTLADGRIVGTTNGVGRQPHDAARTADGTVVITNEVGGGVVFVRGGAVVESLPAGPVQPGGVAALGEYAAVADVRGNGVWVYDGADCRLSAHAPVGVKLTHAVALSGDMAAFADTDGGAVLIERADPQLSQVARVDAVGAPYGLAYDSAHRRLYVTLTASNRLRVIDVSEPKRPRILGDAPTVRQPNSVAVDPRSGNVLVTGSAPGGPSGLQIITPDALPQG